MYTTLFAVTALAGFTSAQSTTSLFLGIAGSDDHVLLASPIASDKTATTYQIACHPSTKRHDEDCAYPQGLVLTQGPATMGFTMTEEIIRHEKTHTLFSAEVHCSLDATSAICTASVGGEAANSPGIATETVTGKDYAFQKVTLTSEMPAINTAIPTAPDYFRSTNAPTAPSTFATSGTARRTGSSSGSATAQSTGTPSGSATIPQSTGTSSGSASAITSPQSTATPLPTSSLSQAGGQAMITPRPEWMIGGAAVAWILL
ncbi:hypothetical protein HYFRA_00000078 [Hymenoscyphus fraxineus]|uniref:GPI anchored cell wall protein n=1 Tax=Hymenoscyphus fraxineus TaxID=746836 RepID=A0A9N9PS84_9HELO|nr:hypothetical protein HYFRA_00000078 [Hymenoscyphus fraxineus]